MNKTLIYILLVLAVVTTFFLTKSCYECKETTAISFSDKERQEVFQKARQGWMPKVSLDSIIASLPKNKAELKYVEVPVPVDSINYVDSIRYKDSTVMVPFYEANEEEVTDFIYDSTNYYARVSVAVRPVFYPTEKLFSTGVGIKELFVSVKAKESSFWDDLFGIDIYAGAGYDPISKDVRFNIGVGFGIRLKKL
jgi:hypothetical protein